MTAPILIQHLESHLGAMSQGWSAEGREQGLPVAEFCDSPVEGVSTFVSLGLSKHTLLLPNDKVVRMELLTCADQTHSNLKVAVLVSTLAASIAETHRAVLKGQVLGPGKPVVPGSQMRHLYVTSPSLLPPEFAELEDTSPPTVFVWIFPVTDAEALFVRNHGWKSFEELLERSEVDLFDFSRMSIPTLDQ